MAVFWHLWNVLTCSFLLTLRICFKISVLNKLYSSAMATWYCHSNHLTLGNSLVYKLVLSFVTGVPHNPTDLQCEVPWLISHAASHMCLTCTAGSIHHPYCTEMSFVTYSSGHLTSLHQRLFIDVLISLHQQLFINALTSLHLCTVCTHLIHLCVHKSSIQALLSTNVLSTCIVNKRDWILHHL